MVQDFVRSPDSNILIFFFMRNKHAHFVTLYLSKEPKTGISFIHTLSLMCYAMVPTFCVIMHHLIWVLNKI